MEYWAYIDGFGQQRGGLSSGRGSSACVGTWCVDSTGRCGGRQRSMQGGLAETYTLHKLHICWPHQTLSYIYIRTYSRRHANAHTLQRKAESSVWFNAVVRGDNELITIGARSNIQDNAVLHSDDGSPLTIGDGVSFPSARFAFKLFR